jgi:hypothetical protein
MSQTLEWAGIASGPTGLAVGWLGKGIVGRRQRRAEATRTEAEIPKLDAEAAKIIADTAVVLVAPLKQEISDLNERLDNLEQENKDSKAKLQIAFDYIVTLLRWISRHVPDKTPPVAPALLDL